MKLKMSGYGTDKYGCDLKIKIVGAPSVEIDVTTNAIGGIGALSAIHASSTNPESEVYYFTLYRIDGIRRARVECAQIECEFIANQFAELIDGLRGSRIDIHYYARQAMTQCGYEIDDNPMSPTEAIESLMNMREEVNRVMKVNL